MRIVFDKNVPVGVRRFLSHHDVRTFENTSWHPMLKNGELLKTAEASGFDVIVTSDQNLRYQQNMLGRKLSVVVLGSNIWPIVRDYKDSIVSAVDSATPGSHCFVEIPPPSKHRGSDSGMV